MSNKKRKYSSNITKKPAAAEPTVSTRTKIILAVVAAVLFVGIVCLAVLPGVIESANAKTYYAYIEIEDHGTIKLELYDEVAPITVENFVNLAESGFYDGLTFHRIMEGFMMQGGDPLGNGKGGYEVNGKKQTIKGEFAKNGWTNNISHKRGVISMARSGDPYYDSASSQFFIVHEDSTFLDGSYAAFGMVLEGMEIVDAICEAAGSQDRTIPKDEQPVITSITIETVKD